MPELHCGFADIPGGATGSKQLEVKGPTIRVIIGFDPNFRPGIPFTVPATGFSSVDALIDTGAMFSCIDSQLADQLKLPVVNQKPISGAGGSIQVNMHLAQVNIPDLKATVWGEFAGVHLAVGGQHHRALIGRSFLKICTLIYEGKTGTVKMIV